MKIYCSRYEIKANKPSNSRYAGLVREGALLKLDDGPNFCGYSDLHPYPEFGDQSLNVQLSDLKKGKLSELVRRALAFAHTDALARRARRNLFHGLALPQCHKQIFTLSEAKEAVAEGFSHLKIKMGRDLVAETKLLDQVADLGPEKLRLDFNGVLSHADFQKWWAVLADPIKVRIDFIEDAFHEISKPSGSAPLAWDWLRPRKIQIRIVKPTRDNLEVIDTSRRVVFTHAFGHLLGQATNLWAAARFYKRFPQRLEVCGLFPSEKSAEWRTNGPRLVPPQGVGFGFDQLLASQSWEPLT